MNKPTLTIAVLALLPALASCASTGSTSIREQRGSYIDAIALTDKQELLANIVRAKYNDPPIFLEIQTVTASPSLEVGVNSAIALDDPLSSAASVVAPRVVYRDHPTILFTPMSGREFTNEMMLPTGLPPIFLMLNNGFDFSVIAEMVVQSVNGVSNSRHASAAERETFRRIAAAMARLIEQDLIHVGTSKNFLSEEGALQLFVEEAAVTTQDYRYLTEATGLPPRAGALDVRIGLTSDGTDLAVNTRSLLAIINFLSNYVEVPPADAGRVWPGVMDDPTPPLAVHWSRSRPANADTSVFVNGSWFYVADTDIRSQNTLYLLRILLDMQAQVGSEDSSLQLTLPVQ